MDWQRTKNYKFEHLWISHPKLRQVVESAWEQQQDNEPTLDLQLKLITTDKLSWNGTK